MLLKAYTTTGTITPKWSPLHVFDYKPTEPLHNAGDSHYVMLCGARAGECKGMWLGPFDSHDEAFRVAREINILLEHATHEPTCGCE